MGPAPPGRVYLDGAGPCPVTSYNLERSHQGYRLRSKTRALALREALSVEELPTLAYSQEDAIEQPQAA